MNGTGHSLASPKSKIERASRHIDDLVTADKTFFDTRPYTSFKETNAEGTEDTYKLRFDKPAPLELSVIIGDAVHNLRSALDQVACCLAVKNGHTDTTGTYFPFGRSKQAFERADTQRKINKLSPDAANLVRGFEPYRGGNSLLWALHELDIIDKHRSIVAVRATRVGGIVGQFRATGLREGLNFVGLPEWDPLDEEIAYLRLPAGAQIEGDLNTVVAIVFDKPDPVRGKQVIATLRQLARVTQGIVDLIETRFYADEVGTMPGKQRLTVTTWG